MKERAWLPYVVPMALYMALMLAESPANLAWFYPVKVAAVAGALWYFRRSYEELLSPMWCSGASVKRREDDPAGQTAVHRTAATTWLLARIFHTPHTKPAVCSGGLRPPIPLPGAAGGGHRPPLQQQCEICGLAVLVGLVAIAIWIGIEPFYPKLGEAKPFDPTTIANPSLKWVFIGCRVFGAVVVVAFMEELFWRGFLIRWLVNEDFKSVPVGTVTGLSFAVTVALFGVEHRDWLAGLICGALYNWLYYRSKNLMACVVAHAVSNAALAGWVLATGDWKFW